MLLVGRPRSLARPANRIPPMLRSSSPGNTSQEAAAALLTNTCGTPHAHSRRVSPFSGRCRLLLHAGMRARGKARNLVHSQDARLDFPLVLSQRVRACVAYSQGARHARTHAHITHSRTCACTHTCARARARTHTHTCTHTHVRTPSRSVPSFIHAEREREREREKDRATCSTSPTSPSPVGRTGACCTGSTTPDAPPHASCTGRAAAQHTVSGRQQRATRRGEGSRHSHSIAPWVRSHERKLMRNDQLQRGNRKRGMMMRL